MLKKLLTALAVTQLFICAAHAADQLPPPPINQSASQLEQKQPNLTLSIPAAPPTKAKAYILVDSQSGKILAQNNANERLAPASLTKLMTLYITYKHLKNGLIHLNDKVLISKKAWQTGGSRMFVQVGTEVTVDDLIHGAAIASGNDACVALAEHIAGSEEAFANMMNNEAKALGMTNSNFTDSNGLPNANHYSSAQDLAILSQALIRDFPQEYKLFAEKWFTYNKIRQPNRNRLLWRYPYADGIKTGHTPEAGYCLAASAVKDNLRLISVILGEDSEINRFNDTIALFSYGFRFYEPHLLYKANTPIKQARIWGGNKKQVPAGVAKDLYVTVPQGKFANVKFDVVVNKSIMAPIAKYQPVGTITATLDNSTILSAPLVALEEVKTGGIFRKSIDWVLSKFNFFKK